LSDHLLNLAHAMLRFCGNIYTPTPIGEAESRDAKRLSLAFDAYCCVAMHFTVLLRHVATYKPLIFISVKSILVTKGKAVIVCVPVLLNEFQIFSWPLLIANISSINHVSDQYIHRRASIS
jgi:hypothetical protein